ncbi:DUF4149 domain-containing protein [Polaromonas sp. CG_9.11]|uniref:DUF4149 domain-containing protein n=1 Tax=Polaromonas sp. CG_9.11 TaxID=2787730 RepID=UPI0018C93B5D|nr:DUF4149 domain-containing protein [Polaromonas sp. CG_9.11]MBG6077337.1 hypothetical protein [Polaromonas sp. CG_9.11]
MLTHLSDLIVAANVGIMLFFTVAVAPTIFVVLPQEWASAYVRSFFPKYYLFLGLSTAGAAALAGVALVQASLVAVALVFFLSRFWLTPLVNRARDNQQVQLFKQLHTLSVALNMLQLAVLVWILVKSLGTA